MSQERLKRLFFLGSAVVLLASCGGKKVSLSPAAQAPMSSTPSTRAAGSQPDPASTDIIPTTRADLDSPRPVFSAPVDAEAVAPPDSAPVSLRGSIVETILTQLGVPYKWGGENPSEGFDCSGLVHWTFAQLGIEIPRSTRDQLRVGRVVERKEVQPGDLVFYAWGSDPKQATHVGVYVGEGEFVHSPGVGKSVLRTPAFDSLHRKHFVTARRIALPDSAVPVESGEQAGEDAETFPYVVEAGDYIWALARRFNVSPQILLELNDLKTDDILQIGQRLLIPARSGEN